jgi:hypothetical protein
MKDRRAIFVALGLGTVALLTVLFKPAREAEPPAAPQPVQVTVDLAIEHGKLASGPAVIRVAQGTTLVMRIRSDSAEEFHLHGYDRMVALQPAKTATLEFVAEHSGRFEFELEKSGTELGALEVAPH